MSNSGNKKAYIGDSVYVEYDERAGIVTLTTENGLPEDPSNTIMLEPEVAKQLFNFIKRETDFLT